MSSFLSVSKSHLEISEGARRDALGKIILVVVACAERAEAKYSLLANFNISILVLLAQLVIENRRLPVSRDWS